MQTGLECLRLEQTYVADAGINLLMKGCPNLRELRVAGCSPHCWMLSAEFMFPGRWWVLAHTGAVLKHNKSCLEIPPQLWWEQPREQQ